METKSFLTLILAIFFSLNTMAAQVLEPEQELPLEFRFLLKTYNELSFNESEKKTFLKVVDEIGTYLSSMEKAELYLLVKSEIYKSILQYPPVKVKKLNELPNLDFKIEDYSSSFFNWLAGAINEDLISLRNEGAYTKLESRKDLRKGLGRDEQILKRKLSKIYPWIRFYSSYSQESAQGKMKTFVMNTLNKINFYSKTFTTLSKWENKQQPSLSLYKFLDKVIENEKTLSEIIDDKSSESKDMKDVKAEVKKNEWKPEEDPYDLFPKPDPNYVPPKDLPKPINDWILDL